MYWPDAFRAYSKEGTPVISFTTGSLLKSHCRRGLPKTRENYFLVLTKKKFEIKSSGTHVSAAEKKNARQAIGHTENCGVCVSGVFMF